MIYHTEKVIVVSFPRDFDIDEVEAFMKQYQEAFPDQKIIFKFNDITIEILEV